MIIPVAILVIENAEDREFMENLYHDFHALMYSVAYRFTRKPHDADDVVNDSCVAFIGKISTIRGLSRNSLRAYIVSTVKNTAINRSKNAWNRHAVMSDDEEMSAFASPDDQPDDILISKERIEMLLSCINRLSDRDQSLLRMRYYLDMDDVEMSRELGVMPVTVRSGLTRARMRVRKMLQEVEYDE